MNKEKKINSLFTLVNGVINGLEGAKEQSKERIRARVNKMIEKLGIKEFFKYVDYNLNKSVGASGSNMSGGQKQVILILRALLNKNSRMIVMDEPSSALDEKNKKIFLNILSNIKNKTIIIITHDDTLIEFVDKVIYLQN